MKTALPNMVFGLSCAAFVIALLLGILWLGVVADHDGRGSLGFRCMAGPFAVIAGLLAIIGGALLLLQRQRRDLYSLILSSVSCLSVLGEAKAFGFITLHGPW